MGLRSGAIVGALARAVAAEIRCCGGGSGFGRGMTGVEFLDRPASDFDAAFPMMIVAEISDRPMLKDSRYPWFSKQLEAAA